MVSQGFPVLLLLLGALAGIGNQAYSLDAQQEEGTGRWIFNIFADGFQKKDEVGNVQPIDVIMVSPHTFRLTVVKAMNGLDTTEPRLKMRQVLSECWRLAGLQPSQLKQVLGYKITNTDMRAALADCRTSMGLQPSDSFVLTTTDTDRAKKQCWDRLEQTIFSSSIRGSIRDFGINKQLIKVEVDNGGKWDHLYYDFS
ncbi:hypothetical protein LZ30DRAFT_750435 [Colletotrichum cereale]|nr:hypothetical protein LZ30DRAFT_750435 [Colletotrichum cereale]